METKLQGLYKELKKIKARDIDVFKNYTEMHKQRDLEHCLDSIQIIENSVEDYYNDDEDCNNSYHQQSFLKTGW